MRIDMKMKKILASLMVGAMVMTTVPVINADFAATAYAAKGGAKLGGGAKSAPKAAAPKAAAPKSNNDTHKSVSGSGDTYKPSKDAKSLDKNAPTANSKTNAAANNAANAQSGSPVFVQEPLSVCGMYVPTRHSMAMVARTNESGLCTPAGRWGN